MRKWHRWLSLFFGAFMLWMAVTGLLIHFNDLTAGDEHDKPVAAVAAAAAPDATAKPAFVCPADMNCRPKPKGGKGGGQNFAGLIKHLHSGEIAGPVGTVLSILTGLALLFFAVSGIWMYVQMWRFRQTRKLMPHWLW